MTQRSAFVVEPGNYLSEREIAPYLCCLARNVKMADSKVGLLSKAVVLLEQSVNLLRQSSAEEVTGKPENTETNINRVILNYSGRFYERRVA